jgi:hypothetical protein
VVLGRSPLRDAAWPGEWGVAVHRGRLAGRAEGDLLSM